MSWDADDDQWITILAEWFCFYVEAVPATSRLYVQHTKNTNLQPRTAVLSIAKQLECYTFRIVADAQITMSRFVAKEPLELASHIPFHG
ncbi:hypothetical protein M413DRAFT_442988 [Hebeloma cylindrosporum]|uniref:Uncharacterized protein n=1 Tax=Hebeloma cylindrosporum TaxID=76867 RepID=A0A0C3CJI3_HEBCY|nr:hypothetical protein M413DRAFT_442988 [Hebeloma cylindrosporum h7]